MPYLSFSTPTVFGAQRRFKFSKFLRQNLLFLLRNLPFIDSIKLKFFYNFESLPNVDIDGDIIGEEVFGFFIFETKDLFHCV